jgi:phage baseplate assembly protein W
MPNETKRFGTDLRLLPNLERENDRFPGSDLLTVETDEGTDLRKVKGVPNLQQALLLRFLTPRGAMAHLGHPEYGSNLHKLVGELNTETNRNRAKLYALEALAQESRIAEVLSVTVNTDRQRAPRQIEISIRLRAAGEDEPVTVTVPVTVG